MQKLISWAVVAASLVVAGPLAAQTSWFSGSLAGDRVVGDSGDGDGWGVAAVGIDGAAVRYYIWVTDVTNPTAAHIHSGGAGSAGDIAVDFEANFVEVGENTYVAEGMVTPGSGATAAMLDAPAAFYVNVHNGDHPAGAVRGQLLGEGAERHSAAGTLRGFRQVDAGGDPDGGGFGLVTFDDHSAYVFLHAENVASPTAAHVHRGTALENGPVVVDVMASFTDGVSVTTVAVDQTLESEILDRPGDFYFNIHSADFPGGAVRGQLRPTETTVLFPVVSRAVGQAGSEWTTGLRIISLTDEPSEAYAEWYPSNGNGLSGPAQTVAVDLFAGELAVIDDAVDTIFGSNGNGAMKIASPEPFRAAARIFNDQRSNPDIGGTFGQAAPAFGNSRILQSGVLLLGSNRPSTDGEGFRSNVGYFNPWPEVVTVELDVRTAGGELLGAATLTLQPYANRIRGIFNLVPSVPQDDRRHEDLLITFVASRPLAMYLSTVDNVTNDAIFVVPESAPPIMAVAENSPPNGVIVVPSGNATVQAGQSVAFEGSVSDPDGDAVSVVWDFGDGVSSTSLMPSPHTYDEAGTYTVTLTATDAMGAVDPTPDSRTITVQESAEPVAFSEIQNGIFNASCAFSGCHGGGSTSAGLSLEAGQAYGNLVDVPSTQQPQFDRIEPNDPGSSYLYLKVTGDAAISGSQMPRGGPPLDQELIDLLRDWIEQGAQNN